MTAATVPMRYVAKVLVSNVDKKSVEGEVPVRLVNYTDVYYRAEITPDLEFMAATASLEQVQRFRVQPGDSIVTKDSESPDDIAVPAFVSEADNDMVCGYHLAMLRPGDRIAPRFLYWALSSDFLGKQFSVRANGMTRYGLTYEAIQGVEVPLPPLAEQRRITDFLDDQVAAVESIVAHRMEQRRLLDFGRGGLFHEAVQRYEVALPDTLDGAFVDLPIGWRVAELGHVLRQLTNGFVGPTRDILVERGVRYIQSLHVKDGGIHFDRGHYFVEESWHRQRPRINLRPGDVLIVQTGDIGQVAVVPRDFGEASCHALQIARVEPTVVGSAYLGEYLQSDFGRNQLLARATGAMHPHLEAGIKSTPVLLPPMAAQQAIVELIGEQRSNLNDLRTCLDRAVEHLAEYRRSLVTATVTGVLDVTTARPVVPA